MLRSSITRTNARRRAAILLITIVLLMLFLVIGICFLVFAEAQATSSRIYREASLYLADRYPTPEEMLGFALGEIIYDVPDDTGAESAIRGHSLARNMYGWNYTPIPGGMILGVNNETPFNGAGRPSTGPGTYMNPFNLDDKQLINYMYWSSDGFKRDPERNATGLYTAGFNAPYTYPDLNNVYLAALSANNPANPTVPQVLIPSFWRGNHTGFGPLDPANPKWYDPTPAAAMYKYMTLRPRPADQLLASEPQTAAQVATLLASNSIFPAPASATGDVINLPGGTVPDSIWTDLGYPVVRLAATNQKIKPMFAFLIVDLDGRVNINVAGNVKESPGNDYHGSNQGFGPWEINPRRLMEDVPNPFPLPATFQRLGSAVEYVDLWRGNATSAGRYGQKPGVPPDYPPFGPVPNFPVPNAANLTASVPGDFPKYYAKADFDASTQMTAGAGVRQPLAVPGINTYTAFPSFPTFYQNGNPEERYYHPSLFNPFQLNRPPGIPAAVGSEADRLLPIADLQKLVAWTTPALPAGPQPASPPFPISPDTLNSQIGKLWPTNIMRYPKLRNSISPLTMDLDRAGAAPGQTISPLPPYATTPSTYTLDVTQPPGITRLPQSQAGSSLFNAPTAAQAAQALFANRAAVPAPGGDLRDNDWRSALADLGRVNLNRRLTAYPAPPQAGYRLNLSDTNVVTQLNNAIRDRQLLAKDIFDRLRLATGAANPAAFAGSDPGLLPTADPNRQQFEALRFLAQLAANIVDYIDSDDVSTSFNFLGGTQQWGWVFGTEMPRVVINEVYAQVQNDPDDQFGTTSQYSQGATFDPDTPFGARMSDPFTGVVNITSAKATADYRVNFFVELHNPHQADQNLTPFESAASAGAARLQVAQPGIPPGEPKNVYKLIIRSQVDPLWMRNPRNTTGDPVDPTAPVATPNINLQVVNFESDAATAMGVDTNLVLPATGPNGPYGDQAANSQKNNGYYVLGPATLASTSTTRTPPNWQAAFPSDRKASPTAPFSPTISVKDETIDYTNYGGTPTGPTVDNRLYATLPRSLDPAGINGKPDYQPTVILQRLVNPYLPPQNNPAAANYNPYITVDYLQNVPINDAVLFDGITQGPRNGMGGRSERQPLNGDMMMPANNRVAVGRRQPFRAADVSAQTATSALTVANTFFTQNGGSVVTPGTPGPALDQQFEWLVHFDRALTSPMDLLYVSTYKPHELTQQFIPAGSGPNPPTSKAHQQILGLMARIPQTRLYRALELMGVKSWMNGVPFGGRVPGKININTVWPDTASNDSLVMRCLTDSYDPTVGPPSLPNRNNAFSQTEAEAVVRQFLAGRTPGDMANGVPPGVPSLADQPIWSLGMPNPGVPGNTQDLQYGTNPPAITGLTKTLLGRDWVGPTLGGVAATDQHPYLREDLLRKIFNNVTTRSNVFAVYVTTGFFSVRDDSTLPVKLGAEVDPQLRHRMFAVVDRTNLALGDPAVGGNPRQQAARPIFFSLQPINPGAAGVQGNLTVDAQKNLNFEQTVVGGSVVETVVPVYAYQGVGPNGVLLIRDTIDHNGQEFSATSGELFTIRRGTPLYVDVGSRMELVIVTEVHPPKPGVDPNNPLGLSTIKFQKAGGGNLSFPHNMGCSICTQRIGNPGPQPLPLDYDAPPYSNTVVPFRMILQ